MSYYSIQKILVPLDLSETSLNALQTAVLIAKKHNATLHILNVSEQIVDLPETHNNLPVAAQTSTDVLTALAGTIYYENKISPVLLHRKGHVAGSIISSSIHEQIDLIVMGTHGASGVREGFIGSNAYQVIKHSSCPVLTIPPKQRFVSFRKIMFPIRPVSSALIRYDVVCHFMESDSILEVMGLSYMKKQTETSLLDRITDDIQMRGETQHININTSWGEGKSVSEDILQFAQENNPEMIVLTSAIDAIVKPNFIGPHTQKLINSARTPLLSIKKLTVPAFA